MTGQQFDRERFDPSDQRQRHPRAFDGHHPRDGRHPAMVLKQPGDRGRGRGEGGGGREQGKNRGQIIQFNSEKRKREEMKLVIYQSSKKQGEHVVLNMSNSFWTFTSCPISSKSRKNNKTGLLRNKGGDK